MKLLLIMYANNNKSILKKDCLGHCCGQEIVHQSYALIGAKRNINDMKWHLATENHMNSLHSLKINQDFKMTFFYKKHTNAVQVI